MTAPKKKETYGERRAKKQRDKKARNKERYRQVREEEVQVGPHSSSRSSAPVEKRKPHGYEPELVDDILTRISEGGTLAGSCRELGVDESTIRGWIRNNLGENLTADPPVLGLLTRYDRAKELQSEAWADSIVEIIDTCVVDGEHLAKAKLRVEVRKWLMSKNHVRKFGDKMTHAGDPDAPLHHIHSGMDPKAAAEKYRERIRADKRGE